MKDFAFRTFIQLINFGYERIFHEEMSNEVKKFFKNLSYVGLGTITTTIFSFTFNILAGRILGPSGYGEFTLVQSVAMFLYIPMLLGFNTAMVKYNAEKEDYTRQRSIISTTYILVFICAIVSMFAYYLFASQISNLFSVPREMFYLSVVFAVLFVFYTLTTSTLRSLHEMKKYAIFQPIYGVILLLSFLVFILLNFSSFKAMVFSMYLAYGITGGIILAFIRKYLRFAFDISWADKLAGYGSYAIISGVSSVFYLNIDKILINKYMAIADVGVYRAYYFAFINTIMLFIGIFVTVFFPVASKHGNKEIMFKRINKIIPYIIILGLPFMIGSGFIILKLYGGEYPFDLKLALLFGIAGICICVDSVYGWLMNAVGKEGVKITSFASIILALANIFLNVWLIPLLGIEGAIIATIIAYVLSIDIVLSKKRYLYNSKEMRC
ncbi:MAG: oligosaccharide flippase family protein [Thermotogae bacterium]|nr:oligosaccharide flippase family protein [Thermotogota bacterium]